MNQDDAPSGFGRVHQWIAMVIAVGVAAQFLLAGVGLFGAGSYEAHRQVGWIIHGISMLGVVAALIRPRTAPAVLGSFALFVALTVQTALPGLRGDAPWVAAFHPLLALVILALAVWIAVRRAPAPGTPGDRGSSARARATTDQGA